MPDSPSVVLKKITGCGSHPVFPWGNVIENGLAVSYRCSRESATPRSSQRQCAPVRQSNRFRPAVHQPSFWYRRSVGNGRSGRRRFADKCPHFKRACRQLPRKFRLVIHIPHILVGMGSGYNAERVSGWSWPFLWRNWGWCACASERIGRHASCWGYSCQYRHSRERNRKKNLRSPCRCFALWMLWWEFCRSLRCSRDSRRYPQRNSASAIWERRLCGPQGEDRTGFWERDDFEFIPGERHDAGGGIHRLIRTLYIDAYWKVLPTVCEPEGGEKLSDAACKMPGVKTKRREQKLLRYYLKNFFSICGTEDTLLCTLRL